MILLLNGLCWELSVVFRQISSIFYGFWDKLDWLVGDFIDSPFKESSTNV